MCLLSKRIFPIRAKEDIICYKILYIDYKDPDNIITPYTKFYVCKKSELNNIKGIKIYPKEGLVKSLIHTISSPGVSIGFIHSYKNELSYRYLRGTRYIQVKCKIPKGSIYYEGITYDSEGYASRELVILEVVDSNYKDVCNE